jgi:ABC-2 type transport system permease protein
MTAQPLHAASPADAGAGADDAPARLIRARDVLASEWTKLRSLRSNRWTVAIAAVVTLGLTAVVAASFTAPLRAGHRGAAAPAPPVDRLATSFLAFAEYTVLPVTVLSVLVFTSEYSSGLIRTTFAAVPGRRAVLAAKAAVTGAAALVIGEVLAFACFFLAQAIFTGKHGGLSLAAPGALRAVLAAGFTLAACALVGVGVGAVIRHTAGAIAAAIALVALLAAACLALPAPWNVRIGRFTLPFAAYQEVTAHPPAGLFSPGVSLLILIAWPAAILLIAAIVLTRRDV